MADQNSDKQQGDPLFFNKVAAALLIAALLVVGLPQLTAVLTGGGHHGGHHDDELHLAYCCVELETAGGGAKEEEPAFDLGAALAAANPDAGKRRMAICSSCHTFDKGGAQSTGPNLWDIIGRDVASVGDFGYSGALQEAGGQWTYERLDAYLADSQGYIPGTAMAQRIRKDGQRAEMLAYLATLSDNPVPFPAPAAAEEPAAEEAHGEDHGAADEAPMEEAPADETEAPVEEAVDDQN